MPSFKPGRAATRPAPAACRPRLDGKRLDLLIEAPHVLGVAQGLLVRGVEPAIGHGEVVAGSGVHSRCHRAACGTTLSTSESKRTGENGLVR